MRDANAPNLDAYWMPFTANRQLKAEPRLLTSAKGMNYADPEGRRVLDGTAGRHARSRLVFCRPAA